MLKSLPKNAYRFLVGKDAPEFKGTFDRATKGRDSFDENMEYSNLKDDDGNPIRRVYGQKSTDTPKQESIQYVNEVVNLDVVGESEESAQPKLQSALTPFGFKVEQALAGRDAVKIKAPDGTTAEFRLDGTEETAQSIRDFVNGKISSEAADNQSDFLKGRKSKNKKPADPNNSSGSTGGMG